MPILRVEFLVLHVEVRPQWSILEIEENLEMRH